MDKIQKALVKLPRKYKSIFDLLMLRLYSRDFVGLNLKRLKGHKDMYRIKHGDLRLVFKMDQSGVFVLQVGLRSEKTYRKF
jgi:mRNA-degrading endonuclease RelE of RelBE toxin-antitoxin system